MDEGNDARGLAAAFHRLADRADAAPIGADAAAIGGEPDILVPGVDDAFQRIRHRIEEAGNGKAARGAAVGQHRRRRHEPQARHRVIETLRVRDIVGIGAGDAGEHVLKALAGYEVAVLQGRLAERRQQGIAAAVEAEIGRKRRARQRRRQRRASFRNIGRNAAGNHPRRQRDEVAMLIKIVGNCRHRRPHALAWGGLRGRLARISGGISHRLQAATGGPRPRTFSDHGRSPGSRVVAAVWPSRCRWHQWRETTAARRLQLRGQPRHSRTMRCTGFPLSPRY